MLGRLTAYCSRVDKFAAACYGRGKAAISLGAWFTLDGFLGGGLKRLLRSHRLGWLPAAVNFIVFLIYFCSQAKVTYDLHPDSLDLSKEAKKFKATTEMILGQFRQYPDQAEAYLQTFQTDLTFITTNLRSNELKTSINHYNVLHEIYKELKPYQVSTCHQLGDGLVHGLSYFYEYLLLVYFEELNVLNFLRPSESFSTPNLLGLIILLVSFASAFQAYSFAAKPQLALHEELLKEIPDDFLNYRESASKGYGSMNLYPRKPLPKPSELKEETIKIRDEDELTKFYATANSARRCYLHPKK